MAAPGQLNLDESPSWGSRSVDCFEKLEQIGEGTYGQVYMAKEKATGEIVALKKVRMDNEKEGFPITAIREIKILKKLHHQNVIELKEIVTSNGPEAEDKEKMEMEKNEKGGHAEVDSHKHKGSIYMVFEYMDHDLTGLADRPGMRFTVPQIKCYMKQLLTGLHYCHVNQVLHRDIKGSNLLIDNNGNLKLADFGLARSFSNDNNGTLTNRVITLWYRPPELLMGSTRYGPPVDMWSVGCIFAELLHGRPILPGKNETEQIGRIFDLCGFPDEQQWPGVSKLPYYNDFKPDRTLKRRVKDYFKHFDRHALELVERMLVLNPTLRITAKDALDAEYFWTDPVPCAPSSLPKYEASHEFQTKKKRQQHRKQQDEMAKRQKTYQQQQQQQQQQHSRLPPLQQQRPGPSHPTHPPQVPPGPGQHFGARGPAGQPRHSQGGRPPHGNQQAGYNAGRGGFSGVPHQQVPNYTAPNMVGQVGRGTGFGVGGGYPQGAPFPGGAGGRPPLVGGGRGQPFVVPGAAVPPQPPFVPAPYMPPPPGQYVDIDGAYARASHTGYSMPPGSPPRPDYHRR